MQAPPPDLSTKPLVTAPNPYAPPDDYGRPLDLLMTGGFLALGTMTGIVAIVYKTWRLHEMSENTSILIIGLLFFVYTGGVWVFSYGWERGDPAKAIRLTVVIVVLSAVAVLIALVAMSILSRAKGGASGGDETGAGDSGGAEVLGIRIAPVLRTAGSYVEDGRLQAEAPDESDSELSTVRCEQCGERFIPVPPKALCPFCGWAAVTTAA